MLALLNAITVDTSNYLNVSSSSVTKMIHRLDESEYLNYEKYRGIRLTDDVKLKVYTPCNEILAKSFRTIGVGDETPNNDAEGIEHHLHPETLKKLEKFMIAIKDKWNPALD